MFVLHKSVLGSNNYSRNWAENSTGILFWINNKCDSHNPNICLWHHTILETEAFSFHCSSVWVSTSRLKIICCCCCCCCSAAAAVLSSINLGTSLLPLCCVWVPPALTLSETCKAGRTFAFLLRASWKYERICFTFFHCQYLLYSLWHYCTEELARMSLLSDFLM